MRWLPAAVSAALLAAAAGVFVIAPVTAQTSGTISACINGNHQLTHVTTGSPMACPSQTPVSWPGNVPGPSPSPGPTSASPSPSPTAPGPSPTVTGTAACTTSAAQGTCGPYDSYPGITGYNTGGTNVSNNVWNPVAGWHQTLSANSPGDWSVTANMPAGNTAVVSYPSTGVNFGQAGTTLSYPLSSFTSLTSSFSESMPAAADTFAEAGYDVWGGPSDQPGNDWAYEVMIQHDYAAAGPSRCDASQTVATASFNGQSWGLCTFGTELIWYSQADEQSGTVDILGMLQWLISNKYLPANYGLEAVGYGFEINSTGGHDETFTVSNFSLTATS